METTNIQSAYILTGSNSKFKLDFQKELKFRLFGQTPVSGSYIEITPEQFDEDDIALKFKSLPFLSEYRLFVLRDCNTLSADKLACIANYLEQPTPTTILLMLFDKIDKRSSFYKSIAKLNKNYIIEKDNTDDKNIVSIIKELAINKEISISDVAAKELAARLGNDEQKLSNAISVLAQAYGSNANIGIKQVTSNITQQANPKYWELVSAISKKDLNEALRVFNITKHNQDDSAFVFGLITMISNKIVNLLTVKGLKDNGFSQKEIAEYLKENPYKTKFTMQEASYFSYSQLKEALKSLTEIELCFKTSSINLLVFEQFIIKICS
ncbi:MAG: DNA polymerase III subunit delta [Coriobacteriales bacterium]|nr:DNA polymerase III subunit delta [Coriobacteriales bacterium]